MLALLLYSASGSAAPSETALKPAEPANGKRREMVFLDAGLGVSYVDLLALKGGELLDPARARSSGWGVAYSTALGVRLQSVSFAARYRSGDFSDWQLWTLGGDVGWHLPLGRIEPNFGFGAAYVSLSGVQADVSRAVMAPRIAPAVDVRGLNLRVNVGLTYYVSRWFSVGANLSGEAFFLRRKGDGLSRVSAADPNAPAPFPYAINGSGNGLGTALSLVLGVHY